VYCWGENVYANCGTGKVGGVVTTPVAVLATGASALNGTTVSDIQVGESFSLVLTKDGDAVCFGRNDQNQCGKGSASTSVNTPVTTSARSSGKVSLITAGSFHSCLALEAGGVQCWGRNLEGAYLSWKNYFLR
jgi:alpha-tubulin suppressor-like RCC1 family protein